MSLESAARRVASQSEQSEALALAHVLRSLMRPLRIPGMETEMAPDPVAQEILDVGQDNLNDVESFLRLHGISTCIPLKDGYGSTAIVLDAGNVVVRLSRSKPTEKPDLPHVLQPITSKIVGKLSVQISKKLQTMGVTEEDARQIKLHLEALGYEWDDAGADNVGRDEEGNLFIIDGSIRPRTV